MLKGTHHRANFQIIPFASTFISQLRKTNVFLIHSFRLAEGERLWRQLPFAEALRRWLLEVQLQGPGGGGGGGAGGGKGAASKASLLIEPVAVVREGLLSK